MLQGQRAAQGCAGGQLVLSAFHSQVRIVVSNSVVDPDPNSETLWIWIRNHTDKNRINLRQKVQDKHSPFRDFTEEKLLPVQIYVYMIFKKNFYKEAKFINGPKLRILISIHNTGQNYVGLRRSILITLFRILPYR